MSALAALVHFDGRTVDPGVLTALAARSADVPPGPAEIFIDGWFGLALAGTRFLPDGDTLPGPHATRDGAVRVAFDGRLDNRDELARALAATPYAPRSMADAEIFACAAAAWGAGAWDRLLGDFAAVVVDCRRREVTGVRDAFGIRPLLYRRMGDTVAFASSVAPLAPLAPVTIDETMMGQYLAGMVMDASGSTFREIRRVPPSHGVTFAKGRERVERYLTLQPEPIVDDRTGDSWAEELRALLDDSVKVRLRCSGAVGLMVSGGIDSAALTAMAARHTRDADLRSYSLVFPGLAQDEQPWSDAVVQRSNFDRVHARLPAAEVSFDFAGQVARTLEPAHAPTGLASLPLRRRAQQDGVRALINGLGGDEVFGGNWSRYADFLQRGRLWTLMREWSKDRHHWEYPGAWFSVLSAIGPLVPAALRPVARRAIGADPVPRVIDRRFARRIDLADRLRGRPPAMHFASYAQRELWRAVTEGLHMLEEEQAFAATFGAEERFPYFDRRLVRFTLRMPERQRWSHGTSKVVLRRAVAGLVPESVLTGGSTHEYSFLLLPALRVLASGPAVRWRVVEQGWVDRTRLDTLLTELRGTPDAVLGGRHRSLWELWQVTAIELLLTALEERPAFEPFRGALLH